MKHFYEQFRLHLQEGDTSTWAIVIVCACVAIGAISLAIVAISYDFAYRGHIFPGVKIGSLSVGGMTPQSAEALVDKTYHDRLPERLHFSFRDQDLSIPIQESTTDTSATPLVQFLTHERVQQAYETGRSGFLLKDIFVRLLARGHARVLDEPTLAIDSELMRQRLSTSLDRLVVDPQEPQLRVFLVPTSTTPEITITDPKPGETYDLQTVNDLISSSIMSATSSDHMAPVIIPTRILSSQFTRADAEPLVKEIPGELGLASVRLTAERREWPMSSSTRAQWFAFATSGTQLVLSLDTDKLRKDIEPLVHNFLREPVDGYLELESNASGTHTFKSFKPPVEGVGFDVNAMRDSILAFYQHPSSSAIDIPLKRVEPKILGPDAETLGIREALGTGRSNFSGSPSNRIRNITLGKQHVHGTLIAPGEEFSLLRTLGPVDGEHGWLPELVIKGNKTTPEFGGGLCQIGTTAFRTALEAGMPITERRNHSYRVRYYEPAGTDATIYDPSPDFKFRNDTDHWILITGDIQGSDVSFTLWGTKDGRSSFYTKAKVYNIVAPPPKKEIETTDLPPGKIHCTEIAHAGADADFDYQVTYANGEVKKQNFFSRYKPWQAVCLVGVAQITQTDNTVDQTGVNNLN